MGGGPNRVPRQRVIVIVVVVVKYCCLLLPGSKSSSAAPLLPLRAPPCIGRGQRIIIILSWQLCHKLFFPYALPLASAGVGGLLNYYYHFLFTVLLCLFTICYYYICIYIYKLIFLYCHHSYHSDYYGGYHYES